MARRLAFDRDRCLACRSCELACAVAHSASGALLPAIDEQPAPRRRVSIAAGPRGVAALRCSQCDEPLCVFSCKSGALHRLADGGVEFDESCCVGCLMCYMVCAWGVRWAGGAGEGAGAGGDDHADVPVRCDVCATRETPACVSACPTKALSVAAPSAFAPASAGAGAFTGHLVVVGSSAAGIAACEAARELAPDCRITMITADAHSYSRPLLPYVLGRKRSSAKITPGVVSAGSAKITPGVVSRVEAIERTRAVQLIAEKKSLLAARVGEEGQTSTIAFDRLVIATGARPARLRVPGSDMAGVFGLREMEDLEGIESVLQRAEDPNARALRAVVVGGGNVGLQAAEALVRRGVEVTVIVRSAYLLSQMLDEEAGRRVGALFARHGVAVRTGRDVAEISGPEKVCRVRLDDGESIDADLVIVGKGIQPNVEWLRSSGVRIGRGILVDRAGCTSVDGVFAAGDCAEVQDPITGQSIVSGIWPIAYEMGRAAGSAAVGVDRRSAGALRMNSSMFFGTHIISIGEVRADRVAGATEHVVEAGEDVYRKLVIKDGRLIGAVLYGDVSDAGLYYRMYRDGTALDDTHADDLERTRVRWIAALAEQLSA